MGQHKNQTSKKNSNIIKCKKRFFKCLRSISMQFIILSGIIAMTGCEDSLLKAWVSHPLDYVTPLQEPGSTSISEINVDMMRGEWRSAVFNLKNSSDTPKEIRFSINGMPGGSNPDYISVYEVQWTHTKDNTPIGAALELMESLESGYSAVIPARTAVQFWLSFHPLNTMAGEYQGEVVVEESVSTYYSLEIPLNFNLFPIEFPETVTLHVGGWDYTDYNFSGVTDVNRDAFVELLQEHFVDSPWARRVLPFGSFDSQNNFVVEPETWRFDIWVEQWPDAKRYCIKLPSLNKITPGSEVGSPEFDAKVKTWIDFWVEHALSKGIEPGQLVLLLLDEPRANDHDRIIIPWANAIHAAQPKITIWEDPIYSDPEDALTEMLSSVDVLCPNRVQMLEAGKSFEDFYKVQKAEGRHLDLYSCKRNMLLLDPYSYIRLQAWTCWEMSAESTFFWSLSDTRGENPWDRNFDPEKYFSPLFITPDSVTPGKHMEALRESAEDFEYLVMLKDAISKADPRDPTLPKAQELLQTAPDRVLTAERANQLEWNSLKNRWIAEQVRLEVLQCLVKLGYKGQE
jgi:hypothetical protein